ALFDLKRCAALQVFAQSIHSFAEDAVGLATIRFIGTDLVDEVVEDVAEMHGIQHCEAKINGELQARLTRGGFDAVAIFEQQNTETVEARVLQGETIFSLIHAEAARTARAGREEDIVI